MTFIDLLFLWLSLLFLCTMSGGILWHLISIDLHLKAIRWGEKLPKFNGRVLVIKDMQSILEMSEQDRSKLFSECRDLFDKAAKK